MEFRAEARFMRVSPQKARLVLNLIQGKRAEDALQTLAFTKKRVAATIGKLLQSAVDNANYLSQEKGLDVDVDSLVVKRAIANDGPRLKRIRPAPMGRAFRYQRRISHIEIALIERPRGGFVKSASSATPDAVATSPAKGKSVKTKPAKTKTKARGQKSAFGRKAGAAR